MLCNFRSCTKQSSIECPSCGTARYCSWEHLESDRHYHHYFCIVKMYTFSFPDICRYLIAGGCLGSILEDPNVYSMCNTLRDKGIPFDVINLEHINIVNKLKSGMFSCFVAFGVGCGGRDYEFFDYSARAHIVGWVAAGAYTS